MGLVQTDLGPLFVKRMTSCLTTRHYNYVTREEEDSHGGQLTASGWPRD